VTHFAQRRLSRGKKITHLSSIRHGRITLLFSLGHELRLLHPFFVMGEQLVYFLIGNESGDQQTTLYDIHKISGR
jgi:hypothetical protein